jgi:hypothetical protein
MAAPLAGAVPPAAVALLAADRRAAVAAYKALLRLRAKYVMS